MEEMRVSREVMAVLRVGLGAFGAGVPKRRFILAVFGPGKGLEFRGEVVVRKKGLRWR